MFLYFYSNVNTQVKKAKEFLIHNLEGPKDYNFPHLINIYNRLWAQAHKFRQMIQNSVGK